MMTAADMADAIRSAMGFPTPVSAQLQGWAQGVIEEITTSALVNNATGTVSGTAAPVPGPLSAGSASGGLISGMSGSSMASKVANYAGYPSASAELIAFCTEIVSHITSMGTVDFASGNITGICTNTPITPGTLTGAGSGGTISGLSGSTLASAVHGSAGFPGSTSAKLTQFCTALVNYLIANAEVSYSMGSVVGVCTPGGGPISAGTAIGGTIS